MQPGVIYAQIYPMISNTIKIHREAKNVTQRELANAVGVSRQTIVAIEKGNYEPSLGLAFKLSNFFKIKIEDLFKIK
jgi:putative transcriptional regulator